MVTFLDAQVETIDAVVRAAEARHYADLGDQMRLKNDVRLMLAALGRDIAARQLPSLSRLEIGSIHGTSPLGEGFLYKRSEGYRGGADNILGSLPVGMVSDDFFGVSIGPDGQLVHFYQNAISGYSDEPLRRLLDDFHAGKRGCFSDGKVLMAGIAFPSLHLRKPVDYEGIAIEVYKEVTGRSRPRSRPPPGEYSGWIQFVRRVLPEHGTELVKLADQWRTVERLWPPDIEDPDYLTEAYGVAAKAMVEHYQNTGEGFFIPDEGVTVGYLDNIPGQPIRLFPCGNLYVQVPLLQETTFWRRKLVVVAPEDYQLVRRSDIVVRALLAYDDAFEGRPYLPALLAEYERITAATQPPNLIGHVSGVGYHNLRRFADVDIGAGIDRADQRVLWFNGGEPVNHVTEYELPEAFQGRIQREELEGGLRMLRGSLRLLEG